MLGSNTKIRIGVLRGGAGKHYEFSLRKGGDIISHILENLSDKYKTVDVLVDKKNDWHINGVPISPADLVHKIDIAWNASKHPGLSITLNNLSIPNIGNESFLKILENDNKILQTHIKNIGIRMPRSMVLPLYQKDFDGPREKYAIKKAKEVFEKFSSPWVVKSFTNDSDMGIHLTKTFPELVDAIEDGVMHEKSILVEEFISGKVVSIHSIHEFRKNPSTQPGEIYTFPFGNSFSIFSSDEREKLISRAKDLHNHLGVKHYLKSDFILSPRGEIYLLNIESMPDLKPDSHFCQVCESTGVKACHIIKYILERALKEKI